MLYLKDTDGLTHTTYFTNGSSCVLLDGPQPSFGRCITSDNCCMPIPLVQDNSKCSGYW